MSTAKIPVPDAPQGPKSKVSKAIEGMSDDVEELKSSKMRHELAAPNMN